MTQNGFVKDYLGPINLEKGQRRTGVSGWGLVGVVVLAWDLWAIRTQKV